MTSSTQQTKKNISKTESAAATVAAMAASVTDTSSASTSSAASPDRKKAGGGGGLFSVFRLGVPSPPRRNKQQVQQPAGANAAASTTTTQTPSPSMVPNPAQQPTATQGSGTVTTTVTTKQKVPPTPTSTTTTTTSNWLCRTKFFHKLCDTAFDNMDSDDSGTLDETELYSGLLLIHLKLGSYVGPPACIRPISRERVSEYFHKIDLDSSGSLNRSEFHEIMTLLFGNVLLRVLAQWMLTLLLVPLMAQYFLTTVSTTFHLIVLTISNLDEHSSVADVIETTLEQFMHYLVDILPYSVTHVGQSLHHLATTYIPSSVWTSLPLTLVSTILGLMVIPWSLLQIDDTFQWLTDRKKTKTKNKPPAATATRATTKASTPASSK